MPSWDVVNGTPLQCRLAEGGLSLLVYVIESLCLFVRGKHQNYGTELQRTTQNNRAPFFTINAQCAKNVVYPEALH